MNKFFCIILLVCIAALSIAVSDGISYADASISPPTNLSVYANSSSKISLTWVNAFGPDGTIIRRNVYWYPTDPTDGVLVYVGSNASFEDTGLNSSTRYYYRAWSYRIGDVYSDLYDSANVSTLGSGEYPGPAVPIIDVNTSPEWWYSNLSCVDSNIPFKEEFMTAANKIGCSPCVLITAAAVAITMAVSVGVFLFVGSIALSFFVGLGMLIGALLTGAIPLWVVLIYGLLGISTYYVLRRA